jgi:hypothetical protein
MSIHEDHHPLDRDTADLLLRGDPAVRHAYPALVAVLAAASAPPAGAADGRRPAGEDAAAAAFTAAHLTSPRPRRIQMLKTTLAKLLTVKVAACVVALGAGGVAVAAGTGALSGPLYQPSRHHAPPPVPAFSHAPPPSHASSRSPSPTPSGTPPARPGRSADLARLCAKWMARPGGAVDEPEFGNLVREAGRRDRVDRFCADLRTARPQPHPSGSVRPSGSGNPGPRQANLPSGTPNSTRPGR